MVAQVEINREVSVAEAVSVLGDLLGPQATVSVEGQGADGRSRISIQEGSLARARVRLSSGDGRTRLVVSGAGFGIIQRVVNELGIARRVARTAATAPQWQGAVQGGDAGGGE